MLYDTDLEHMAHAITPSRSKLESKQVQSVGSRITTLSKHLTMDIDAFKRFACDFLTDSKITLTAEQIAEIEALSQPYFTPEWIFGRHCRTALNRTRRIEGLGEFTVGIELKGGLIADITVGGDFFQLCDIDSVLLVRLRGTRYTPDDIRHALSGIDVSQVIAGLSTSEFIKLLIQ